jgi:alkanesulfonate monooxygenase SsuD/methylene tetrahydromethanopterin reductase-like flavin-dependent oxidoreductase (luciferase family)
VAPIPIWVGGTSDGALRRAARQDGWIGSGDTPESATELLRRLRALRAQAGLGARPFEAIVAVAGEPDLAVYRRLEEAGATAFVSYPPAFGLGPGCSLEAKRRAIGEWSAKLIARY